MKNANNKFDNIRKSAQTANEDSTLNYNQTPVRIHFYTNFIGVGTMGQTVTNKQLSKM